MIFKVYLQKKKKKKDRTQDGIYLNKENLHPSSSPELINVTLHSMAVERNEE